MISEKDKFYSSMKPTFFVFRVVSYILLGLLVLVMLVVFLLNVFPAL